ncbi:MAG: RagB/SusD family nutrient uptake outer membrane protein [Bacteroidota bacterium]|nr:RagB/SusD family nutrient uptake outer membrane protein [Bacteroidota bacterium]
MKKIFYSLFLATALLSCKKSDTEDASVISGVTSDAEALALANAVYGPLQTLSSSYSFLVESQTESTISFEGTEDKDGPLVSRFETKPSTWYPIKVFSRLYKSIGAANTAIEKISAADTSKVSKATRTLTIARAKFIRGYDYFNLVQLFGEIPLVLSTSSSDKTRKSIDEVYAQIVKDLTEAKTGLPEVDANKSNPSRGAANTILAKVYLTWGQNPLSQSQIEAIKTSTTDPTHTVDNAKLEKAVAFADSVISKGKYSLLTDYNAIFGSAQENGNEHIFTIHHDGDGVDAQGNHQTHCAFTNKFDLVTDNHIGPADPTLIDRFSDKDTRKKYSYTTQLINPLDLKTYSFAWPVTTSRYGKFIHRAAVGSELTTDDQPNDIDHIDFRYAEVFLIKAEALFFLNRASEALPLVNKLRERAYGSTQYDLSALTKEDLYKEWDLEFTYEQKHWTNLVRWRTLISTVKTVSSFEYFKDKYASETTIAAAFPGVSVNSAFFAKIYKHLHAKYTNVSGKFYRFPIPLGESSEDLGITPQNPGY